MSNRTTTLSSKYQISIPKHIREKMGWKPGQEFAFFPKEKGVLMTPIPTIEEVQAELQGVDTSNLRDRDDRY